MFRRNILVIMYVLLYDYTRYRVHFQTWRISFFLFIPFCSYCNWQFNSVCGDRLVGFRYFYERTAILLLFKPLPYFISFYMGDIFNSIKRTMDWFLERLVQQWIYLRLICTPLYNNLYCRFIVFIFWFDFYMWLY